jgi:hypothetical protein
VQPGSIRSALGPPSKNDPAQQTEIGDLIPPLSPVRLRRWIHAGQRRLTGEGGDGEEAWTKGNPRVVVGWMEAHYSGVSTVVVLGR